MHTDKVCYMYLLYAHTPVPAWARSTTYTLQVPAIRDAYTYIRTYIHTYVRMYVHTYMQYIDRYTLHFFGRVYVYEHQLTAGGTVKYEMK